MSMLTEIATAGGIVGPGQLLLAYREPLEFLTQYAMRAFGEAPALNIFKVRLVGVLN